MTDIEQAADNIEQTLPDDIDVSRDEIIEPLKELTEDYKVPVGAAERSVRNKLLETQDGASEEDSTPSSPQDQDIDIADLTVNHDEQWFNISGTVQRLLDLTEKQAQYVNQRGVIGDNTGTTIFTVFNDAVEENPSLELEQDESYELRGVVGDAYKGDIGIKLTKSTTVKDLEEAYQPPDNDSYITGCVVDIQDVSGLIKRCSLDGCTRVLDNNRCAEHGEVDGEFDLRLKTVIDDGNQAQKVFFGLEETADVTGISLDDAIQIAEEAMDTSAVIDKMKPKVLGRYYQVAGNKVGEFIIANEYDRVERDWNGLAQKALNKVNEMEAKA